MSRPQPYVPKLPLFWWLGQRNYRRYMLREITSAFIGSYVALLIVGLYRLKQGAEAWGAFREALSSVPGVTFQVVALAFALYHTVTWFKLAPATMPLWRGETKLPPVWVHLGHYAVWIVVSLVVLLAAGV